MEVLDLAGNSARDRKRIRITPRDLQFAILNDEELVDLIANINWKVLGGGVMPNIHPVLIPKKKRKRSVLKNSTMTKQNIYIILVKGLEAIKLKLYYKSFFAFNKKKNAGKTQIENS